jgi:S1-C subfamily serine protease
MKQKISLLSLSILVILMLTACSGTTSLAVKQSTDLTGQAAQVQSVAAAVPVRSAAATATLAAPVTLSSGGLSAYESALEEIYTRVNPSVVNIRVVQQQSGLSSGSQSSPSFGLPGNPGNSGQQYSQGLGSGFIWDTLGHIVTNNHVVDGASKIEVMFADGTIVPAELVGADPDSDLAVIKVDVAAEQLTPVQVADSTQVKVGQIAIAIGNPFGLENTMTVGIVSALGRSLPAGTTSSSGSSYSIPDIIQTDAPINPGNSGGVLVNGQGQLIGVTAAIESPVQASAGIGLVIPSSLVQRVVPELIKAGKYEHSYLGVTIATLTPDMATAMKLDAAQRGALIVEIASGGPAEKAGLQGSSDQITVDGQQVPVGGDVITAIDGQPVKSKEDLIAYLAEQTAVGQKVALTILRGGSEQSIDATLAARPAQQAVQQTQPSSNTGAGAWLGISAQPMVPEIAKAMGLPESQTGVLIQQVESGSPADQAGFQGGYKPITINGQRILVGGDVITAIDGQTVTSMSDLRAFLSTAQAGQQVTLDILRDGQSQKLTVTLAERASPMP